MRVRIPTPLRSYTAQAANVEAEGATVAEVLADLDRQFPGLRFRVVDEQGRLRQHMKVFVNEDVVRDLTTPLDPADEVTLMQALSGG
ncbi:MAG: MoaD/ThiS family protein [Acidimicrobiales bacterium]|nr:MoaD/ThiS family protein [Acidimicrobiales bacterium]